MRNRFAAIRIVVPFVAFFSLAQQPSSTDQETVTTLRASAHLVVLDAVVTDKHGNPVRNLTKSDFTILEDGQEQTIASFEPPSQHVPAPVGDNAVLAKTVAGQGATGNPTSAPAPQSPTASAVTILVLDELDTPVKMDNGEMPMTNGRIAVQKYLREHGPRLTEPTALMVVGEKRLELLHDYTSDAADLESALRRYPAHLPFRLMGNEGPLGSSQRLSDALEALREIAAANGQFAGRKNVIWIGPGFPSLNYSTAPPASKLRLMGYVKETSDLMWKGRLAIYTVDPRGLEAVHENIGFNIPNGSFISPPDSATSDLLFEQIAPQTGGRIFRGLNDLDAQIATSVADGDSYYALSYYPTNHNWDGKFRTLRIIIRNPNLIARTRNGYYADPDEKPTTFEMDRLLSRAVINPLSYHSLEISATGQISGTAQRTVHIKVSIDANQLHWNVPEDGKRRCEITLVTAGFSARGRVVSHAVKEFQISVDQDKYVELTKDGMVMNLAMALPPTAVRMRVVARDSTNGNLGTADLTAEGQQFH